MHRRPRGASRGLPDGFIGCRGGKSRRQPRPTAGGPPPATTLCKRPSRRVRYFPELSEGGRPAGRSCSPASVGETLLAAGAVGVSGLTVRTLARDRALRMSRNTTSSLVSPCWRTTRSGRIASTSHPSICCPSTTRRTVRLLLRWTTRTAIRSSPTMTTPLRMKRWRSALRGPRRGGSVSGGNGRRDRINSGR